MQQIIQTITNFLNTTPPDVLGWYILLFIAPFVIFAVLIWGFLELWLDSKQGQYWMKIRWRLLAISVPQDAIQTPKGMENFFSNLAGSKSSITWKEKWMWGKFQPYFSLELASINGYIQYYIRTPEKYIDLIQSALYAQYPEAQITEVEDYTASFPDEYPDEDWDIWGSEMTLSNESIFPIKTWDQFEHQGEKDQRYKDPILPTLEILGNMKQGENYIIQILIMPPDSQDWIKKGRKFICDLYGKESPKKKSPIKNAVGWVPEMLINEVTGGGLGMPAETKKDDFRMFKITPEERDQIELVKEKISKLGWLTKVRFIYVAKKELFRKGTIASMSKGIWNQYALLHSNKFGLHGPSTPKDDYFWMEWGMAKKQKNLMARFKKRGFGVGSTPFILNSAELASIWHFPAADARTPVLSTLGARRSEAPPELKFCPNDGSVLMNTECTTSDTLSTAPPGEDIKVERSGFSVPSPRAITTMTKDETIWSDNHPVEVNDEENTPQKGMPAPLPPGLEITDAPKDEKVPDNLPI